jgi:hypothetical protein
MRAMRYVLAFVVGACLSGPPSSAWAQSGIPTRELPGTTSTVTGTVVSSTTTALVLEDDRGARHQFRVDGSSALPAGLVAGMRVSATFERLEGGRAHLVSVSTSDTMDSDHLGGQPVSSPGALDGVGASWAAAAPPALEAPIGGDEPPVRTDAEPARREDRHEGVSPLPPILVTAAVALGVAVALLRARRVL